MELIKDVGIDRSQQSSSDISSLYTFKDLKSYHHYIYGVAKTSVRESTERLAQSFEGGMFKGPPHPRGKMDCSANEQ